MKPLQNDLTAPRKRGELPLNLKLAQNMYLVYLYPAVLMRTSRLQDLQSPTG